METTLPDVSAIKPILGAKYSPNLYKWLTKRDKKHRAWTSSVFRDSKGVLWIGRIDEGVYLIGCRLMRVLCLGGRAESMAYPLSKMGQLEEVADFWESYVADGRCAIDPEHHVGFVAGETRWRTEGDRRECLWCGKVRQNREIYTETVECSRWINCG